MLIYNITTKVDNDIEEEWLLWQKEIHIPGVMSTGLFYDHRFFKLLGQDESDGKTFVIQFYSRDKSLCETYTREYAGKFTKKTVDKWGEKCFVFQSLLESVQ